MTEPDDEEEGAETEFVAADDRVIGKAFRWSLWVFLAIGVVVGVVAYLQGRKTTGDVVVEGEISRAQVQNVAAEAPQVKFTDVTEAAGIAFVHTSGATGSKFLPETMGPGCAFLDYDRDEDPDILIVNSKPWPDSIAGGKVDAAASPTSVLYRNEGAGMFVDVTRGSGLDVSLYGVGVAVGDYDADGWQDVFLTTIDENRLFRNNGGKFEDVTDRAGVAGDPSEWSTSAGFFDCDNDGDLDLFVCNYVRWSREIDVGLNYQLTGVGRAYGPPTDYKGTQPYFYRNDGDGTFTEVAEKAGLHVTNSATGLPVAKALALMPIDVDRDGWLDFFVANDTVKNFLFHNRGDGTFEEVGDRAGVAFDANGSSTGAMGIDATHYRNDGTLGVAVGNFANEMSSLYVAENDKFLFSDEAIAEGIGPVSRKMLSFGLFFFDYDLDGRLDLFQTNGHLEEEINKMQPSQHYRQPSQLFWNCGPDARSCFVPVSTESSGDLGLPVVGRSAAYADYDGDGDLDVLLTQTGDRAVLLRNDQNLGNHWLRLRLVGKRTNRDAIGVWVEADAGGVTQRRQVMPTRSYLAQMDLVLTFGLGRSERADAVRIYWPGEEPQELGAVAADTYRIVEQWDGEAPAEPIAK